MFIHPRLSIETSPSSSSTFEFCVHHYFFADTSFPTCVRPSPIRHPKTYRSFEPLPSPIFLFNVFAFVFE